LGFDGSRFNDATGLIATHIATGYQWLLGVWEHPHGIENWEVPEPEVDAAVKAAFEKWDVWRMYADPPYWETTVAKWAGQFGEERVLAWWSNRTKAMAYAIKSFSNAIASGELTHDGSVAYARHIGNACRRTVAIRDDQGIQLWTMYKERSDSPHKIDLAMAGVLSWEARCDALAAGVTGQRSVYEERGIFVL
jgi:phage terminase large subunit-like protein